MAETNPRRLLAAVVGAAFVGSACVALADAPASIAWSSARPLTWDDFVGTVPGEADPARVAASNTSLSWSYQYRIAWTRGECSFEIVRIESAAEFIPAGSWVRPGHENDRVLRHEQGHFDITRIHQRRFAESANPFVGVARPCRGNSERRARRSAEREIAELVGSLYEDTWQQHEQSQEAYDRETRHGIDTDVQAEWTARLADLLR